jgi:hypothetical protein
MVLQTAPDNQPENVKNGGSTANGRSQRIRLARKETGDIAVARCIIQ